MAKKVAGQLKLQVPAGSATPSPPIGPALGQRGINIMEFCKAFNAQTQAQTGTITPVVITVYEDRSFSFITKTPPAPVLIREALGIKSGSARPLPEILSVVSRQYPGKVIDVSLNRRSNVLMYDVKLITPEGKIIRVRVDAESAVILGIKGI